jgi:hypothetical protein
MATKKREIYARVAVQLRGHTRAIKAEKAAKELRAKIRELKAAKNG